MSNNKDALSSDYLTQKWGDFVEKNPMVLVCIPRSTGIVHSANLMSVNNNGMAFVRWHDPVDGKIVGEKEIPITDLEKYNTIIDEHTDPKIISDLEAYPVNQEFRDPFTIVNIPRSNGSIQEASIVGYNANSRMFFVLFDADGIRANKSFSREELDRYNTATQARQKIQQLTTSHSLTLGNSDDSWAEAMTTFTSSHGDKIAGSTDKGFNYKPHNEDRVVLDPNNDRYTVIDGIGGHENGDRSAQILSENIQRNPNNISQAVEDTQGQMRQEGIHDGGACFASLKFISNQEARAIISTINPSSHRSLYIEAAGDVRLIHYDSNGHKKFATFDQTGSEKHIVTNAIQANKGMVVPYLFPTSAEPGDYVVMCSDGISDNLTDEQIGHNLKHGLLVDQVAHNIGVTTRDMMKNETGKADNRSLVVIKVG